VTIRNIGGLTTNYNIQGGDSHRMKLNIIVDKMGDVVGAFQSELVKLDDASELRAGVIADPDKTIPHLFS
jgi:hypothetical protein